MRGAVASGHPLTCAAAIEMLQKGGNAFDAAIAAAFAATVTEPCLTSLGGGGFLLGFDASSNASLLYDFFVDSPGKGADPSLEPHFVPVEIRFASTGQVFHTGMGSVGVPGLLKGLITCMSELGTLDTETILAPALRYLRDGVEVNELQSYRFDILRPILTATDYGRELFAGKKTGDRIYNPLLREFFEQRSPDAWLDRVYGGGAGALETTMRAEGGLVTARDMAEYAVARREPIRCEYRGAEILTNGPPSFGGGLLRRALEFLDTKDLADADDAQRLDYLAAAMDVMNGHRNGAGGTTHVSILDEHGSAVSLTMSNGSNSGCYLADTGIMLNNMMGEDDLHPVGFHRMQPGIRVGSMMSPTIVRRYGRTAAVLGSGGSKRIRTAMLQVLHHLLDRSCRAEDAVEAPRIHLDDEGILQIEPGFAETELELVRRTYTTNEWSSRDLYFGGVHMVTEGLDGWGDSRRGGAFLTTQGAC